MAEPRLATGIWVAAYLARLRQFDIPAFVVRHGDDTAGATLIKLNTLDGRAQLFERGYDILEDRSAWRQHSAGTEADIDAALATQRASDPDLWIIEVEDRAGRHLLDQDGLA